MGKLVAWMGFVVVLLAQSPARAERIYGITKDYFPRLFHFDSATPGNVTLVGQVSGVDPDHLLYAIDFRPATGQLYGISESYYDGNDVQVYTISLTTGVATELGSGFTISGEPNFYYGIDFDPVTDQLRLVTGRGRNLRINPDTGAVAAVDTDVSYPPGDLNAGLTPRVSAIAYARNLTGTTSTLFAFDDAAFPNRNFARIGSIGGTPTSPNTGLMSTRGGTGLIAYESTAGMDISATTRTAYLQLRHIFDPRDALYTLDLSSGAATPIGEIGPVPGPGGGIRDISVVVPEPSLCSVGFCGGVVLPLMRRRQSALRGR